MKLIGFDFDRVLFQTDRFKEFLDEEIPGFLDSYPDGTYSPTRHAENLDIDVSRIYEALEEASNFVYSDVDTVENLEEFEVVIVTRGDPRFQRRKIEHSGVLEHFDGLEIVENGEKESVGIDFLVDDREKEVEDSDIPGMVFDRDRHSLSDAVERIRQEFS
jgi:FMN phosphatase YigB (HAD superfamily)